MSVPANFKTAISAADFKVGRWLEIEGIPYAYGTISQGSGFFSGRAAAQQFLGIQPYLTVVPRDVQQTIDTLDGGAQGVGKTDFEIGDIDGEPTKWIGVGYTTGFAQLRADITAATVTIDVDPAASPGFTVNQYIYIGTETLKVTALANSGAPGGVNDRLTVTRGLFRSTAQAWGKGYPVGTRAYVMANRRCWYNEVAVTPSTKSFSTSDPDKAVRFAGLVRGFDLKSGEMGAYVLSAETMEREFDRPCFRELRSLQINSDIRDGSGNGGALQVAGYPGFSTGKDQLYPKDLSDFPTNGEEVLLLIDNEVFLAKKQMGGTGGYEYMQLEQRALFGTKADKHKQGALAREIVSVVAYNATGRAEEKASKFSSAITTASPLKADHPLLVILQVMLSTGLGTNYGGGALRNYDVLPKRLGMAIDYTRVDIAGIERVADEEPDLRFGGLVFEPPNFVDFMRTLLKFSGYYFTTTIGDKLTIKRLRPPNPDETTRALTNSERIRDQVEGFETNWSGAIRELTYKFGYDLVDRAYKFITTIIIGDADVYSKGLARSLNYETKLLYPGNSGIRGEFPGVPFDVDAWLLTRRDFFKHRYGRPPPIIRERVNYSFLDVELGDLVGVTATNLPNATTGARGLTGAIGEVIGKTVDEQAKVIDLTILMTDYQLGRHRFIAPALEIARINRPQAFWVKDNSFTAPIGTYGGTQYDLRFEDSLGNMKTPFGNPDSGFFNVPIRMYTTDFSYTHDDVITNITNSPSGFGEKYLVEISTGDATAEVVGSFLTYGVVDDMNIVIESENPVNLYAFMADNSAPEKLGALGLTVHRLYPG